MKTWTSGIFLLTSVVLFFFILFGCARPSSQTENFEVGPSQPSSSVSGVLTLGLERKELLASFPPPSVREIDPEVVEINDTTLGIEGTWTLGFRGETLSWFSFTGYTATINPQEFDSTLEQTEVLLDRYSQVFGSPLRFTKGIQEFKDPRTYHHEGYQVLHALWETDEGRIILDFSFIGEGESYAFLVTIQGS